MTMANKNRGASFSVPKELLHEMINLYMTILVQEMTDQIEELTDGVSTDLVEHKNEDSAIELLKDVRQNLNDYEDTITHLIEMVEETLVVDSLKGGTVTMKSGQTMKASELSKMLSDANKEKDLQREQIKKRIEEKEEP